MSYNKIYFLKNFETEKTLTFSETNITLEELKSYNEKGWNIYESVNTFIGNDRKSENIAEIKSCFIDIDYPEILNMDEKERASFLKDKYKFLQNEFNKIENKFGIKPTKINLTYKGFHILYNYAENCYFIETKLHQIINNKIIDILKGDENAKDISRVYKVVGFIDWKNGKKGKIKELFFDENNLIQILNIKNFGISSFKIRDENKIIQKSSNIYKKKELYQSNIEKINKIDSMEFINKITEFLKEYPDNIYIQNVLNLLSIKKINDEKFSFYEKDGKNLTSGLFLEKNSEGIFEINDYSKKNRRGNYNFLKNWCFLEFENNQAFINKILSSLFFITPTKSKESHLSMDFKLLFDYHNNKMKLDEENHEVFINYTNEKLLEMKSGIRKVFYGLFTYIANSDLQKTEDGDIAIEWDDFVKKSYNMNKKDLENHKKTLKNYLIYISNLSIPILKIKKNIKGEDIERIEYDRFCKIGFDNNIKKGRGNKDYFYITPLLNSDFKFSKSIGYKNKEVLNLQKGFKNLYVTDFFDSIVTILENTNSNVYVNSVDNCFKILELNGEYKSKLRTLKKYLDLGIQKSFFSSYEFYNDKLTIYKKSKI